MADDPSKTPQNAKVKLDGRMSVNAAIKEVVPIKDLFGWQESSQNSARTSIFIENQLNNEDIFAT